MKKIVCLFVAGLFFAGSLSAQTLVQGTIENAPQHAAYTPSFKVDGSNRSIRNIILMIGDGTGLAQIAAGLYSNGGALTVTNLQTMGLVKTQSADAYTTDSAASGTAYATGHKTLNYAVGVDTEGRPLRNIPEILADYGIISGVITTDAMTGATPSSFYAHQPNRSMTPEIWADLPGSSLTFFAAGSEESFRKQSEQTRQAIQEAFTLVHSLQDVPAGTDKLGYLPPKAEVRSFREGRGDFLPATTRYGLDYLASRVQRRKGFFMMVEGARIDKSCHANEYAPAVLEMLDFDQAVEQAIRFAEADGHTLVIITADHETGGLSLQETGDPSQGNTGGRFVTGGHTPIPVPLFAYGPGSQFFRGIQENDEVGRKIIWLLTGKKQ
ncbi:MAG: alkaline phosphatase [Bacteroidales bacterium]|nr:alkaline phosphatase [Bacteroidales bacterium]